MAAKKGTTKKTTTKTAAKTEDKTEEKITQEQEQQAATGGEETTQTDGGEQTETQSGDTTNPDAGEKTPPKEQVPSEEEQAPVEEFGDVPEELRGLAMRLDDYVTTMAPNVPLNSDEIQTQQLKLRAIINTLLKTEDEKFNDAMKHVVNVVRDNRKGVFSERMIFRGFPQMKLARSERQRLEILISLLLATADAQNPSKVTDVVDMNVVFRYVTDNDQQQRLQSYYGM